MKKTTHLKFRYLSVIVTLLSVVYISIYANIFIFFLAFFILIGVVFVEQTGFYQKLNAKELRFALALIMINIIVTLYYHKANEMVMAFAKESALNLINPYLESIPDSMTTFIEVCYENFTLI